MKKCRTCDKRIRDSKTICDKCRKKFDGELKPCPHCNNETLYYFEGHAYSGNVSYRKYHCTNCDYTHTFELDCG